MSSMTFPKHGDFKRVLEERVEAYFQRNKLPKRDRPSMYVKAVLIILLALTSYTVLVYFPTNLPVAILAATALAVALVGIGFNIQHDGNHDGFSKHAWINRLAGWSLDLLGASSYYWKTKHNVLHHTYTNVAGKDDDINLAPLARLSPGHRRFWFHKYQHLYLWAFYTMVHLRYFYSDAARIILRRVGGEKVRLPRRWDLWELVAGKAAFFTVAFLLPCLIHPFWVVMAFFIGISFVMGFVFSVVFQMAHMIDLVDHPGAAQPVAEHEFTVHQILTTANFATRSRFWTVCLGGLNFQREHHLFPRVSHVHYPALSRIVRAVCAEYRVPCHEHPSMLAALRSHYRFLKLMGAS